MERQFTNRAGQGYKFYHSKFTQICLKTVVTDKSWVASLGEIGDKFFPGIEFKTFTFDDK